MMLLLPNKRPKRAHGQIQTRTTWLSPGLGLHQRPVPL